MTSVNQHPGQSDHMLMCKQWWRVCWMYGDQEKFYRQLYRKKNTSRAIVTSTSTTLSNYDNLYSELCNKTSVTTVNASGDSEGTGPRKSSFRSRSLPRQGAYKELYGLGATLPLNDDTESGVNPVRDRKVIPIQKSSPSLEIPTISSSVSTNNSFHGSLLNSSLSSCGKSGKPRLFPFPKELCDNMRVLAISPDKICDRDTVPRPKVESKKRARNGDRISTREMTTVTTLLTFERQILTSNK